MALGRQPAAALRGVAHLDPSSRRLAPDLCAGRSGRWSGQLTTGSSVKPLLSPTILVSSLATAAAAPVSDVFKYFAGDWHCDGVFPASGRRISSRVHYDWDARTGGLIVRHDDEPPFDYHSLEMWAPPTKADAQNMIVDAHSGARLFTAKGWSGQTLTWLGVSDGKVQEEF